jgi:hypothetical protein
MGTFRSKVQKSDDYENDFEEEMLSDEGSDYKDKKKFEIEKTGNFGDQNPILA